MIILTERQKEIFSEKGPLPYKSIEAVTCMSLIVPNCWVIFCLSITLSIVEAVSHGLAVYNNIINHLPACKEPPLSHPLGHERAYCLAIKIGFVLTTEMLCCVSN